MTRVCFTVLILLFTSIFVTITSAQKKANSEATIKGEVIDTSLEQNPISKVKVKVVNAAQDKEYQTHTNKDGEYEITGLPAGRYTVSLSKDGYGDRVGKPKLVAEGGEIFDRFKMRKKGNILFKNIFSAKKKAGNGATIKGVVIDTSPEQNPISKVNVKVVNAAQDKEYQTHTNKDGEYEIIGLPADRYIISVSKDGYGDRVGKSKVVAAGGEIFDRFKMQKNGNTLNLYTLYKDILMACVLSYILFFNPLSSSG